MGMDVSGLSPTTEKGIYFRNNVWWWRPLASFIENTYPEIADGCEGWHSNDGFGLDAEGSAELARRIRRDLADGTVDKYKERYYSEIADLPRTTCSICEGSGIRTDEIGVGMGQPTKELEPEVQILTGRTHGWCNGCAGVGDTEHFLAGYPFDVDNVSEFCDFLEGCGGFAIY